MKVQDFVTVHLGDPREQHWGRLLRLDAAGVIIRGIDVRQLESFRYQFKKQEQIVFPQTVFFPMRRIEQISLDEATGNIPSTIQLLRQHTGLSDDELLQ